MNVYSILCVSLTLAHYGFTDDTESPIDESIFSSTENAPSEFSVTTEPSNGEGTFSSPGDTQLPSESSTASPCPENMEIWIMRNMRCFCVRPFLLIPLNGTCCKPFRQGPCPPGYFVPQSIYFSDYDEEPQCIPNPCVKDGLVPANGTCIDITTRPPCTFRFPYYNETISEIQCLRGRIRSKSAINAPLRRKCPSGRLLDKYGKCRQTL